MDRREFDFQSSIVTKSPVSAPHPSPSSAATPSSVLRLWRPAAQRNIRNQWSMLLVLSQDWSSSSSSARLHATSLVNSFLSQSFSSQVLYGGKLLSCYKDMVAIVTGMVNSSRSMGCNLKGSRSSPLAQFSCSSQNDNNDSGDGSGVPVFTFWSIDSFEELASEVVQMFMSELTLKRLLVMELPSIRDEKFAQEMELKWSNEFYTGEFDNLRICNLFSEEACEPVLPSLRSGQSSTSPVQSIQQADSDVLQVG